MKAVKVAQTSIATILFAAMMLHPVLAEYTLPTAHGFFGAADELVYFSGMAKIGDRIFVVGGLETGGEERWHARTLDANALTQLSSRSWERFGELIAVRTDGSALYATGYTYEPSWKLWVVKFDLQWNVLWEKSWADPDADVQLGVDILISGDDIYVLGLGGWPVGSLDVIVQKWSKTGNLVWSKRWGGERVEYASHIILYDGKLYIAGATTSFPVPKEDLDGLVLVMDTNGNELDRFMWGGDGYDRFSDISAGGDLYIVGRTGSYGSGSLDVLVLKMSLDGNVRWYRTYGREWDDRGYRLVLNGDELHICGKVMTAEDLSYPAYLQFTKDGTLVYDSVWEIGLTGFFSCFLDLIFEAGTTWLVGYTHREDWSRSQGILAKYVTWYTLTVSLPGSDYWASLDGNRRDGASVSFDVTYGQHNLEAMAWLRSGNTRYVFDRWGDGSTENPRSVSVTEDTTIRAIYRTEVLLEVSSSYSTVGGGGWVESGTQTSISIGETTVDHGNGTRRIFTGWFKEGSLFSSVPSASFQVTGPMALVAGWRTEHRVQVSSEQGTATGGGWISSGSSTTASVSPTTVAKDFFTNYVFEGWKVLGSIVSTASTYTFTVTAPVDLVASWKTELNIVTVGGTAAGVILILAIAVFFISRRQKPSAPLPPPPPPV